MLLDLPATRDWIQALAIRYTRSRGQIIREGLALEVREAERKLDALVARAATPASAPWRAAWRRP